VDVWCVLGISSSSLLCFELLLRTDVQGGGVAATLERLNEKQVLGIATPNS
jgi:hypothetical protein